MTNSRHQQQDRSLFALIALLGVSYINETGIGIALPAIHQQLHATAEQSHWIVNAYLLYLAIAIVAGGRLADLYGLRRILGSGCLLVLLGSLLSFAALEPIWLILGRALQGIGTALILPSSLALVSELFPDAEQGRALGRYFGLASLFLLIGPLVTAEFIQHLSWRLFFLLPLPLIGLSWRSLKPALATLKPTSGEKKPDFSGFVTLSVALSALVIATMEGNAWGWTSTPNVVLMAVAGFAAVIFVRIERTSTSPLVDLTLFRRPAFVASSLIVLLIYALYLALITFLPVFLQMEAGLSPLEAGVASTLALAPQLLMARVSGRLADQHGPRLIASWLAVASVVSFLWLALWAPSMTLLALGPGLLLYGMASPYTVAIAAALRDLPDTQHGEGSGLLAVFGQLGGSPLGVAVVGSVVSAASQPVMFRTAGFQAGMLVCAAGFLVILCLTRWLPTRSPSP